MNFIFRFLSWFVLALFACSVATAKVISFDDVAIPYDPINPTTLHALLDDGYAGFVWGGSSHQASWVVSPSSSTWFEGQQAHSGENFAWSNGGSSLSMEADTFDFFSFWARVREISCLTRVTAYYNNQLVHTSDILVTPEYQQFFFDWHGVNKVTITNLEMYNILLDDISVSAVPEPASAPLLLVGLVLCFGLQRVRRKVTR